MARVIRKQVTPPLEPPRPLAFAIAAGVFFFIAIIKLGDPVILDSVVTPPQSILEAYYESWPAKWGYCLAVPFLALGLTAISWKRLKFKRVLVLPGLWLAWQFVAATQTVSSTLTAQTISHFTICVALFYLGYFVFQG